MEESVLLTDPFFWDREGPFTLVRWKYCLELLNSSIYFKASPVSNIFFLFNKYNHLMALCFKYFVWYLIMFVFKIPLYSCSFIKFDKLQSLRFTAPFDFRNLDLTTQTKVRTQYILSRWLTVFHVLTARKWRTSLALAYKTAGSLQLSIVV